MSEMPPPPDYESLEPPPYFDEGYDYVPEPVDFIPIPDDYTPDDGEMPLLIADDQDGLQGFETPAPEDEGWHWHDARLIGVDKGEEVTQGRYEIGGIDVFANPQTGDLGASYLPIATLDDVTEAEQVFDALQEQMHAEATAPQEVMGFATRQAFVYNPEPENWRSATLLEYAAYDHTRGLDSITEPDMPPDEALDPLIETAIELGGVVREADIAPPEAEALAAIGIQADGFSPDDNPPPFIDETTQTAYWIGVFQADAADREHCVTSILSIGRDADSDQMVAHLAPCVAGDWDKTHAVADYLLDIATEQGMNPCFDAAEGIALATDQRELWQSARGVPLTPDTAQDLGEIAQNSWEVDL